MPRAGAKLRPAKHVAAANGVMATARTMSKVSATDGFRIDVDIEEAQRAAERVRGWLTALRERHDLSRYEYTRHVRIVPASATYSHPILTLGTRFAESEDHLLATYLHEQMHWYLYRTGGIDHDPVAPFFDELVRRYPKAPTRLPDGARNYEQTYVHLVVCWLELKAASEFIGWDRAVALADTNFGYRWIYRTVVRDWDALGQLYEQHGLLPMQPAPEMLARAGRRPNDHVNGKLNGKAPKFAVEIAAKASRAAAAKKATKARAGAKRSPAAKPLPRKQPSRRKSPARGGRSAG